jgi:hypothetical protein
LEGGIRSRGRLLSLQLSQRDGNSGQTSSRWQTSRNGAMEDALHSECRGAWLHGGSTPSSGTVVLAVVAQWQTHRFERPVSFGTCWFESSPRHLCTCSSTVERAAYIREVGSPILSRCTFSRDSSVGSSACLKGRRFAGSIPALGTCRMGA